MSLHVYVRLSWVGLSLGVFFSSGALAQVGAAAAEKPAASRWALLIGVDNYTELGKLRFAGNDQRALAKQLVDSGFPQDQIFLLHEKATEPKYMPFRENIEKQIELVFGLANPGDLLIVGFSGHGVQLEGKSYFCPMDTRLDRLAATMIPLDSVYDRLAKCRATLKLLLVDACRNDVLPAGRRSVLLSRSLGEFAGAKEKPPEGILLLASCGPGQVSMEDEAFGHGVFMHYLLEGLGGKAANAAGTVSLAGLYDYASLETKKYVARKFNEYQTPALRGEISGPFEICTSGPVKFITNSIGMKLVLIPAGEFWMGSSDSDKDAPSSGKPQHRVRITKAFYVGVHEVTVGQFRQFVEQTRYKTQAKKDGVARTWQNPGFQQTDEHPVVRVSWNDATEFCKWLSGREGTTYSLPTEAEWEYACRARSTTRYSFGDNADRLGDFAWFGENARNGTRPVGQKKPNAWGLFDVHGNVWEWCADWLDSDYYRRSPVEDPPGPTAGSHRVLRGGSWSFVNPVNFRCASLIARVPSDCVDDCGFRVVRTLAP